MISQVAHVSGPCGRSNAPCLLWTRQLTPIYLPVWDPGFLVPTIGFELMTYRLQGDCTTTVLIQHITIVHYLQKKCNSFGSPTWARTTDILINSQTHLPTVLSGNKMVPVVGFELTTYRLQGDCNYHCAKPA